MRLKPASGMRQLFGSLSRAGAVRVVVAAVLLNCCASLVAADAPLPFLLKWGRGGFADGQFNQAFGIAVSATGFVYVSDTGSDRIQRFRTDSVFVNKWGSTGSAPGQFNSPTDLTVDPAGNVYVVDLNNGRIQKFDPAGTFLMSWPLSLYTLSIAADPSGGFLFTTGGTDRVDKYTTSGQLVGSWTYGNPNITAHRGLAVDADGFVYVASQVDSRVIKFTGDGALVAEWGSFGNGENQFDAPIDVAIDPDGNVYVVDVQWVRKFTPNGVFLTRWGGVVGGTADGEFGSPIGIATDIDGNVYVLEAGNSRVQKFGDAPTPVLPTTWGRLKAAYRER